MGATALLYLGPLLAGLSGQGWRVVPVFGLIFLLWIIVMRPAVFPRDGAAWATPQVWLGAVAQALVQLLLVCLLFGAGRGIGGVMGFLPVFHPLLPVAISFLSVPLSRLVWDPVKAEKMDRFLDEALTQIQGMNADFALSEEERRQKAEAETAAARSALTRGQTDLAELAKTHRIGPLLRAMGKMHDEGALPRGLRLALVDWATDPAHAFDLQGTEAPTFAFLMAQGDPGLCRRFAEGYETLLDASPEAYWDGPSNRILRAEERAQAGTPAAEALHRLRVKQYRMARARLDEARAAPLDEAGESADHPAP